ncbi:258_t:CDS:2 [Entrophospora sp. SA101]|nr:258_t:CDS:2 [Entrophospora sp. SA101]
MFYMLSQDYFYVKVGYSQNQLYEVVSKIDEYSLFVPFCTSSEILNIQSADHKTTIITAALGVGFQGFSEIYVSEVTCESPRFVQAVASSDVLFRHLVAIWNFTPYINNDDNVGEEETTHCILDFRVEFEFSSPLHLQIANIFSDQVNEMMITAFEQRSPEPQTPPASASCYDRKNPLDEEITLTSCMLVTEPDIPPAKNQAANNQDNMFNILIECNSTKVNFCNKVKKTLEKTGQIISKIIKFKEQVVVRISFKPLGQAGPSRVIGLKSGDGVVRLYPQALAKQFGLKTHPEFLPNDIIAEFSSEFDFWFEEDGIDIAPTQIGFLHVTLHEFLHGLGFHTLWRNYFRKAITELTPLIDGTILPNNKIIFNGFIEGIFDKFVVLTSNGTPLTDLTNKLNEFAPKGTEFDSLDIFYSKFIVSPQYKIATDMLATSTTPLSLALLTEGLVFQNIVANKTAYDQLFYLETSLLPFQRGSSLSHVSEKLYTETSDFLMRYRIMRGVSLEDSIKAGGNYAGGAIGPKLQAVLESLGYATKNKPNPEIPTLP